MPKRRPKLAVWKFASCDGCQLTVLDCEPVLRGAFDIAYFLEASSAPSWRPLRHLAGRGLDIDRSRSRAHPRGPSRVHTARRHRRVRDVGRRSGTAQRARSRGIPTRGLCEARVPRQPRKLNRALATRFGRFRVARVPDRWPATRRRADRAARGAQAPIPGHSVCLECKLAGNVCVTVAHGTPCLGPITQAGLRCALSPARSRLLWLLRPSGYGRGADPELYLAFDSRGARSRGAARVMPTPEAKRTRTIRVDALSRVEGEGSLFVRVRVGASRN